MLLGLLLGFGEEGVDDTIDSPPLSPPSYSTTPFYHFPNTHLISKFYTYKSLFVCVKNIVQSTLEFPSRLTCCWMFSGNIVEQEEERERRNDIMSTNYALDGRYTTC